MVKPRRYRTAGILITFIISGLIIGGVLAVYTQHFAPGGCGCVPVGTLVSTSFSNPRPNITKNGGGWFVVVEALAGDKVPWETAKVTLEEKRTPIVSMDGVKITNADIYGTKNSKTGKVGWFLKIGISGLVDQIKFSDGYGNSTRSPNKSRSELMGDRFETVQGASFIVIDADYDGIVTKGDYVLVFADSNADGIKEITRDYRLTLSVGGEQISGVELLY